MDRLWWSKRSFIMDIKTAIRTSAIIYSDELGSTKTTTIKRKYIESIFLMNENSQLIIDSLLHEITEKFNIHFSELEIVSIVNNSKDFFEYNELSKCLNLTNRRYNTLKNKEISNTTLEKIAQNFVKIYPNYSEELILDTLYKFLYELLNSSIETYTYILKPQQSDIKPRIVNTSQFSDEEVDLINNFITWNNEEKNKELYKLVSFAIEYALVCNNSESSIYIDALKNKVFYLDNNVIYRAIGTDGDYRKDRILYFFDKCIKNGQKLCITYYTKKEFKESIDYHLKELSKIPYGTINPKLFSIANCDNGFYEFYHKWRQTKNTKALNLFKAFMLSEYDNLIRKYKIEEDYSIPFVENDKGIEKQLTKYFKEIKEVKKDIVGKNSEVDSRNMLFIEKKRGNNKLNIKDTKYYLLSSDQRLKEWDNSHSNEQPLIMLPSQWMGLLLKYVSRTDDDFSSFITFLKIPKHDSVLAPHEIEDIVSGISEITEDFVTQEKIMENLVNDKFTKILKGEKSDLRDNVILYSQTFIEDMYKGELIAKDKEAEKREDELKNQRELDLKRYEEQQKNDRIKNINNRILDLNKLFKVLINNKEEADDAAKKTRIWRLACYLPVVLAFYIILFILTFFVYDWNVMEPITYFIGLPFTLGAYLVPALIGKSINPLEFFYLEKILKKTYEKKKINIDEINDIKETLEDLTNQLNALKNLE